MRRISTRREKRPTNCNGPEQWFDVNVYEIETTDVNRRHPNFGGYQHAEHQFSNSDVGRHIESVSQPNGYTCWYFIRVPS